VIEESSISVGGGLTFRVRSAGPADGRLVLLLHGFPQTSSSWTSVMGSLAEAGYRAVAFDQRG
jgi:pimeloyl-ACP methyl ester carboxylesterase